MSALAAAAFAAGLLGGVHCAGMCGGIVASLSVTARGPVAARQLAFNAGRIASYSIAGAIVGAAGSLVAMAGPALVVQTMLFVVANMLMMLLGLYVAGFGGAVLRLESAGRGLWRRVEPYARRVFPVDSAWKALAAGAFWGWVPCGLVYSMLALALASGDAVNGALVMAAFGLGTLPTLLTAGFAAQKLAGLRRHPWIRYPAAIAIIAMGIVGLARVPGLQEAVLAGWHCVA
jgi:sulfite exporter TauE/SafE